MSKRFPC